jgi:nitroreductase
MAKNDIIKDRRSIRKFDPSKQVTREQMNILLEAAMLAPSARNLRPWEFIAVTTRKILDEIPKIHANAAMCSTATAAIIIVALPQELFGEDLAAGYFSQDCGAATQNILLRAVEIGLGTCWCGVYPREERIQPLRELLNIEAPKVPFCVIAVGTPDESPSQRGFFEADKVTYVD